MLPVIIVVLLMLLIISAIVLHPVLIKQQRKSYKQRPFPSVWEIIIQQNLPIYSQLSPEEIRRLKGHIQVVLAEKQFIGCQGLQVTLEMKLVIASVACLLLLNEQNRYFSKLRSILIYPHAYKVQKQSHLGNYIVEEQWEQRLGESWRNDQLVLSWEQIKLDTKNWQDGRNLILHEFAHQLDQEDGETQGVPILPRNLDYHTWGQIMREGYQKLCDEVQLGLNTVIDSYGTTNAAEFFAVVTETFFEKPSQLWEKYPKLYFVLQKYYKLDPLRWF